MKHAFYLVTILVLIPVHGILAQTAGDFRSAATGNWSSAATWETYNGTEWEAASISPTSADGSISIQSGHVVTVTADVTVDQLTVNTGGTVLVNSGVKLTVADGTGTDIAVSGTLTVNGTVRLDGTAVTFTTTNGTVSYGAGSRHEHATNNNNVPKTAGSGSVTWHPTSTIEVTGIIGGSVTSMFLAGTTYGNIIWNSPGMTASNVNFAGNLTNIAGYFRMVSSGATPTIVRFFGSGQTNQTVNLAGDFILEGGSFQYCGGTSTGCAFNIGGNWNQTGGTYAANTGSTNMLLMNFTGVNKSFTQSGGAITNTNLEWTVKNGASTTLNNNIVVGTGRAFNVEGGGTLNCGTAVITGPTFTLNAAGTLGIGSPDGITSAGAAGNIQTTARNFDVAANYTYNGSAAQVMGTGLPATVNNLTINNANGVTLSASTAVDGTLSLMSGDLDLNGNDVSLGTSGILSETPGNTVKGTSGVITASRSLNAPDVLTNIAGLGIGIGSLADLGTTAITRGHAVQTGNGNSSIRRYFDITPANNTGLNATFGMMYDVSELNSIPESNLTLFKSVDNGVTWTGQGGTVNTLFKVIYITDVNSFSRWTAGNSLAPLPVQLASFSATYVTNVGVRLDWMTISEINNYGFEVQRSAQRGSGYASVSPVIPGHGTTNEPRMYTFTENGVPSGQWFYRLKQIDLDGSIHFSEPVSVDVLTSVAEVAPREFMLHQNFPNPFNPSTQIRFTVEHPAATKLEVFNLLGAKVATLFDGIAEPGRSYTISFDAQNLSSGMYLYRLESGNRIQLRKLTFVK